MSKRLKQFTKEVIQYVPCKTCIEIFKAVLWSQKLETTQMFISSRMNKLWSNHKLEYYTTMKTNKCWWLLNISWVKERHKIIYSIILFTQSSQQLKLTSGGRNPDSGYFWGREASDEENTQSRLQWCWWSGFFWYSH